MVVYPGVLEWQKLEQESLYLHSRFYRSAVFFSAFDVSLSVGMLRLLWSWGKWIAVQSIWRNVKVTGSIDMSWYGAFMAGHWPLSKQLLQKGRSCIALREKKKLGVVCFSLSKLVESVFSMSLRLRNRTGHALTAMWKVSTCSTEACLLLKRKKIYMQQ